MTVSNTSSIGSGSSTGGLAGTSSTIANNFDQFLTLLTTQLKNQTPLDPLDTNQFTAQLVQFAGVEQQLKTNETLASLLSLNSAGMATSAVGFIGTTVSADGATTELRGGAAEWKITAPRAGAATITIRDALGSTVKTFSTALAAGDQNYTWDGRTSTGAAAPDGPYTITVDAADVTGTAMTAKTMISGVVDGVDFSGSVPALKIGDLIVPISNVKSAVRS